MTVRILHLYNIGESLNKYKGMRLDDTYELTKAKEEIAENMAHIEATIDKL